MMKRGLILMVGATGSGKSTSIAAMINHRNEVSSDHIVTIEDPIEFLHTNKRSIVNQREVGLDTKSFSRALRGVMRAAPDVILIGEIRDKETMEAAISLAGTGHLVLSTLHANNVALNNNGIGIQQASSGANIRIGNSDITNSTTNGTSGTVNSYGNNRVAGNAGTTTLTPVGPDSHDKGQQ